MRLTLALFATLVFASPVSAQQDVTPAGSEETTTDAADAAVPVPQAAKPPAGAAAVPAPVEAKRVTPGGDQVITITLVGDVGLNASKQPVLAQGAAKFGRIIPFAGTTTRIAGEINGDINFLNVETVVTTQNDLPMDLKGEGNAFNFRTHPNAMRHMVKTGFNVFGLANNHSMDFGVPGLVETLKHIPPLKAEGLLAYGGIGMNRKQASAPVVFTVKDTAFAFASIGIVTNNLDRHRAGPDKPGQIAYRFDEDWKLVLQRLHDSAADYRL